MAKLFFSLLLHDTGAFIAERSGIAETTVKTRASRIIGKLGVKRRGQAVARARELRMIE